VNQIKLLLMALAVIASSQVHAKNVTSMNPSSLVRALQDAGYRAALTKTEKGTPVIETAAGGNEVRLALLDCVDGERCQTVEFIGYWNCAEKMKQCIRAAQKFNDEESPAKAIPFPDMNLVGVCYYMIFDEVGITAKLFIKNFQSFAFYNDAFSKSVSQ
jgi:hypothetical protein